MSTFFKIQTYKKPSQYSQYAEYEGQSVIIGNNGNEIAECENVKTQHEAVPRPMARAIKCNKCLHWTPKKNACWWMGLCALDGNTASINSKCRTNFVEVKPCAYGILIWEALPPKPSAKGDYPLWKPLRVKFSTS